MRVTRTDGAAPTASLSPRHATRRGSDAAQITQEPRTAHLPRIFPFGQSPPGASSVVSTMSHPTTARLFIALELPAELRAELHAWARAAAAAAARGPAAHGLRLLDAESLHLTIHFLGAQPIEEIQPLCDALPRCARPLGPCSLGAPLWLPRRRPRTLAVEVHDDARTLAALHRDLLSELAATLPPNPSDSPRPAHAPLRPHVTVARMRAGTAPRERLLPPTPQRSLVPAQLTLYRSWLAPDGASYEPLASCAMPPLSASS